MNQSERTPDRAWTEPDLMGLIREHGYRDRTPPDGWHPGRDRKVIRELKRKGYSLKDQAAAILGFRDLVNGGHIEWIQPGEPFTMRVFNGPKVGGYDGGALDALQRARDYFHSRDAGPPPSRRSRTEPARVSDVLSELGIREPGVGGGSEDPPPPGEVDRDA